jgi:hypothetical protein
MYAFAARISFSDGVPVVMGGLLREDRGFRSV